MARPDDNEKIEKTVEACYQTICDTKNDLIRKLHQIRADLTSTIPLPPSENGHKA